MKNYNYCEQVDRALQTSFSKDRTLRSCLDPGSNEWSETTMQKRIEILKKVVSAGNNLQNIFLDYKRTYQEMNKANVVNNLEEGLIELLKYLLSN